MPDFYERLNAAQKEALCHYKGPAIVLAGPGSGKTTVLTGRVRHLIEQYHVPPASILVITYTKAAALSMRQRFIREMNGQALPVNFGTFHAIFYHILKEQYHLKQDSLLSHEDKLHLLLPILKEQIQEKEGLRETATEILQSISLYKNGRTLEKLQLPTGVSKESFIQIYGKYTKKTFFTGKMDFDDMLVRCLALFKENPEVLLRWQKQFQFILVDEFQDCNRVQAEVLQLLAKEHQNLFVVGDDDQAIYGFRGASPGIMKQFTKDYPGAKQIYMEANYRSRTEIVNAANLVIAENKERFQKCIYAAGDHNLTSMAPVSVRAFGDKREQFTYLTKQLLTLSEEMPFEEMAVICRTNGELAYFLPCLAKQNIPFEIKEQLKSRYSHFTVQDVLSYVELAAGNRARQLLLRILQKPKRQINRECFHGEEFFLEKVIEEQEWFGNTGEVLALRLLQKQLKQISGFSPYLAIRFIRGVVGYDKYLQEKAGGDMALYAEWKEILDEVQEEAKAFLTLKEWVDYTKQEAGKTVMTENKKGGVQLMTMHAAKGLEFTYVCIMNVNEGKIPYGKMITEETEEEERRLFYVGMTRAKKALDILYLTGTKEHPRLPSRFLKPLYKDYSPSTNSSNS